MLGWLWLCLVFGKSTLACIAIRLMSCGFSLLKRMTVGCGRCIHWHWGSKMRWVPLPCRLFTWASLGEAARSMTVPCSFCVVDSVGQQSSPLRVAEHVAAAASHGQWGLQRPGTRHKRPPGDAPTQLGSPSVPAPARRRGLGPRWHWKWTRNPQRYWRYTAANNDHYWPKFGRGTSKVSGNFWVYKGFRGFRCCCDFVDYILH